MHAAARRGHDNATALLLNRGADIEARSLCNHIALHFATSARKTETAAGDIAKSRGRC
ncbi:MAG: ankyrin repeat domain-containing protein [Bacteroidota bacterium]